MTWYAFQSLPQREFQAEAAIRQLGYRTCLPIEWKWRRQHRHTHAKRKVKYPLFVGYVFAGFERSVPWLTLLEQPTIRGVVAFDGRPASIPDEAIDYLNSLSGASVPWNAVPNPHRAVRPGELALITVGPFAGHNVKIQAIEAGKAKIFLSLFNATREMHIPLEKLEAA